MLNKYLLNKLLWLKPVQVRLKASFRKCGFWLPVISPGYDLPQRIEVCLSLHVPLGPGMSFSPSWAMALLQCWCQPPVPRSQWGGGGWEETHFRAVGKKRGVENKSRGSGLELRGGNPEVESLSVFCTNPPCATYPPGLKGRCRILPGIHRDRHLPLLNSGGPWQVRE